MKHKICRKLKTGSQKRLVKPLESFITRKGEKTDIKTIRGETRDVKKQGAESKN